MSLPTPCVLPLRISCQDSAPTSVDGLEFISVVHDHKVGGGCNGASRPRKRQRKSPVQSEFTTYEPLRLVRFGIIIPLRLTVVVCETPPSPSKVMTPTSATGPTGPAETIDPVVEVPYDPSMVSREHVCATRESEFQITSRWERLNFSLPCASSNLASMPTAGLQLLRPVEVRGSRFGPCSKSVLKASYVCFLPRCTHSRYS